MAFSEEILRGGGSSLAKVNLSLVKPTLEIARSEIDKFDRLGAVQEAVRNGFAHGSLGDGADDVRAAFEMLDVDGRMDIDAGIKQLRDIHPSFRVPRSRCVGVREFIHQRNLRTSFEERIEIQLREIRAAVVDGLAGESLDPLQHRLGLAAAMGFDNSGNDIHTLPPEFTRRLEHGIGLAHPRTHAEEDFEFAGFGHRREILAA